MWHLQELGLDISNASLCYYKQEGWEANYFITLACDIKKKGGLTYYYDSFGNKEYILNEVIPAYTLQDVLDVLPKYYHIANIGWTKLSIRVHTTKEWEIGYVYTDELSKYAYGCRILGKELIDAAYKLFCWCIKRGFVETNKTNEV